MQFRMKTWRNIALVRPRHNRPPSQRPLRRCEIRWAVLTLIGLLNLAGCARPTQSATEVQAWSLSSDEPVLLTALAQVRVSPDRPLPEHVVQRLCPEYALVVVSRPTDWEEICRRLALPAALQTVDLNTGPVIGLLADVGEHAENEWPVHIVSVRNTGGQGTLEASFRQGVYYPLRTAGYLELAKITGTTSITTVQIDSRVFTIRRSGGFN
jgi:hypothetical protein